MSRNTESSSSFVASVHWPGILYTIAFLALVCFGVPGATTIFGQFESYAEIPPMIWALSVGIVFLLALVTFMVVQLARRLDGISKWISVGFAICLALLSASFDGFGVSNMMLWKQNAPVAGAKAELAALEDQLLDADAKQNRARAEYEQYHQTSTDMDNDRRIENDHLIPGMKARAQAAREALEQAQEEYRRLQSLVVAAAAGSATREVKVHQFLALAQRHHPENPNLALGLAFAICFAVLELALNFCAYHLRVAQVGAPTRAPNGRELIVPSSLENDVFMPIPAGFVQANGPLSRPLTSQDDGVILPRDATPPPKPKPKAKATKASISKKRAEAGRRGGQSRSSKKVQAAKQNLKKTTRELQPA